MAGVILATTVALLATACGSQAQRSAAPVSAASVPSSESASAVPSSEPSGGLVGSSGNLGTRVCVINESTRYRPFVTFSKKDSEIGAGTVAYQERACAEGTFGSGSDVEGSISPDKTLQTLDFYAGNPWIGKPYHGLTERGRYTTYVCIYKDGFDVNEARTWDDGVIRYVVKRLPDDTWKEFTITVSDSQDPTSDGTQRTCPAHGGAYPA